MKKIGLVLFRESLGKTQEQMALELGVSTSFYQKIEQGGRNPSYNFLIKLKKKYGTVVDNIFFEHQTHNECDVDGYSNNKPRPPAA